MDRHKREKDAREAFLSSLNARRLYRMESIWPSVVLSTDLSSGEPKLSLLSGHTLPVDDYQEDREYGTATVCGKYACSLK